VVRSETRKVHKKILVSNMSALFRLHFFPTQLFVLRLIRLSICFMCSQFFPSGKFPFIHIGYLRAYLEYLVTTPMCASPEKKITFSEFGQYKIQSVVKAELPYSHDFKSVW
jgi:hypothetical protein